MNVTRNGEPRFLRIRDFDYLWEISVMTPEDRWENGEKKSKRDLPTYDDAVKWAANFFDLEL